MHDKAAGRTLDVRAEAAAIEEQDHLAVVSQSLFHRLCKLPADGAALLRRCAGFVPQVDRVHIAAAADRSRAAAYRPDGTLPSCAACQLSSDGVAEPSTSGIFSELARCSGHVAGVIPRLFVLLERCSCSSSMTISPRFWRGGKDGAARPDDDLHFAGGNPLPMPVPLGVAEVASAAPPPARTAAESLRVCGVRLISGTSTIACRP